MRDNELSVAEIIHATVYGEIIEEYPDDFPLPSCLVLGYSRDGDPVHSVWAYDQQQEHGRLVTAYRPDPTRWIRWRLRR